MIPGDKERKIKQFLYIDYCADGIGWAKPDEGCEFIGIPYGWYGDNSQSFIETRKGGKVVGTTNCIAVSDIEFEEV